MQDRAGHLLRLCRDRLEPSLRNFVALDLYDQSGICDAPLGECRKHLLSGCGVAFVQDTAGRIS
ncbi:hypothetical protein CWO89_40345 [Bradyrhizobium sp. Leo170]|nr:hypothetical protein CWO89_40345 [Bradyrhizobium sp. Leo170]